MKVWVTIDDLDGTTRVRGPYWPDEIDTFGLLMRLAQSELASVTFTRHNPLDSLIKGGSNDGSLEA